MAGAELRVGVIGCGRWANWAHLPGWTRDERCQVVAVCDSDPDLAQAGASGFAWPDRSPAHADATAPPERSPSLLPASGGLPPTIELSGDGQYLDLPALAVAGPGMAVFVVADPRPLAAPGQLAIMRFIDFACVEGTLADGIVFGTTGKQGLSVAGASQSPASFSRL